MNVEKVLDAKGLACPMPIVKAKKAITDLEIGQVLEIHATDKGSQSDIAAWSKSSGHELLEQKEEEGIFKFWVRKQS